MQKPRDKNVPGTGNSKVPEARENLLWSKNRKEKSITKA